MTASPFVVLITGGGAGIGRALALEYAGPNTVLILLGRRKEKLFEVAKLCEAKGSRVITAQADVRDVDALRAQLITLDTETPIDLLIANAGVTSGLKEGEITESWLGIQAVAETNFYGALATISAISERMVVRKKGQICIIGSLSAYRGMPYSPSYCAAKAGIETYGFALRAGLAESGVRVNVVSPGYIATSMSAKLKGTKPFVLSPEKAAMLIRRGLRKNKARTSFPFPLNLGARLLALMPDYMARTVMPWFAFSVDTD